MTEGSENKPDGASKDRPRNASIDWMRVGSIWYIVGFWHLFGYTYYWDPSTVPFFYRVTNAVLGLFVLISGYLLGQAKVQLRWAAVGTFYWKRLLRIYPPYLAALALFAGAGILGASPIKAALLISMVSPPAPFTLWFVTMIVLFYLISPLLITGLGRPAVTLPLCLLGWALAFAYWLLASGMDTRLLIYFPVFVAGLFLARYPLEGRPAVLLSLLVLTLAAYAVSLRATGVIDQSIWSGPVALFGSLLIFLTFNHRLPTNRAIAVLSAGSFFLYLFHRLIYMTLMKVMILSGVADPLVRTIALYVIGFPFAVLFGIAGQRGYDWAVAGLSRPRCLAAAAN